MGKLESKSNKLNPNFIRLIRIVDSSINEEYIEFLKSPRHHNSVSKKNSMFSNVKNTVSILEHSLELSSLLLNTHLINTINLDLISSALVPISLFNNVFDNNSYYIHNEIVKFIYNTILWIDTKIKKACTLLNDFVITNMIKQPTINENKNNLKELDNIFETLNSTKLSRQSSKNNDNTYEIKKHKTSTKINNTNNKITLDSTSPLSSRNVYCKSRNSPNNNVRTQISYEKSIKTSNLTAIPKTNTLREEKPQEIINKSELKKGNNKLNINDITSKSPKYSNLKKIIVPRELLDNKKHLTSESLVTNDSQKKIKTPFIPCVSNEKQSVQETKNIKNININIKLNIINKQGTMTPKLQKSPLSKCGSYKRILPSKKFEVVSKSPKPQETIIIKDKRKEINLEKKKIPSQDRNTHKSDSDKSHETISSKKRNTPHFHLHKNTNSFGEKDYALNDRFSFKPIIEYLDLDDEDCKIRNKSFIHLIEPKIKHQ